MILSFFSLRLSTTHCCFFVIYTCFATCCIYTHTQQTCFWVKASLLLPYYWIRSWQGLFLCLSSSKNSRAEQKDAWQNIYQYHYKHAQLIHSLESSIMSKKEIEKLIQWYFSKFFKYIHLFPKEAQSGSNSAKIISSSLIFLKNLINSRASHGDERRKRVSRLGNCFWLNFSSLREGKIIFS